jgi:CENP-Q, a CENPA-CAD centromere complex subunit
LDDPESIGLVTTSYGLEQVFDSRDPDIKPLLDQFSNHLTTMHANIAPVSGVDEALTSANAALAAIHYGT